MGAVDVDVDLTLTGLRVPTRWILALALLPTAASANQVDVTCLALT